MKRFLAAVFASALFCIPANGRAFAQQSQPSPSSSQGQGSDQGSDASQPQKKPAAKPKDARDSSSANSPSSKAPDSSSDSSQTPAPAKDENPFPEAVSREAARSSPDAPDAPEAAPAKAPSASAENPFPEDVSRSAAKGDTDSTTTDEDGQKRRSPATDQLPPGVSSSRSSDEVDQGEDTGNSGPGVNANDKSSTPLAVTDPLRAKKDTQVGSFYFQTGNYRGAYLRYKDALGGDPTNVDAIFGLAEAARALKLNAEAEQNYKLYLEILPHGSKAKEALKALHSLSAQK